MAQDQDEIDWRGFMEIMVFNRLRKIQATYAVIEGFHVTLEQWTTGVVIKLFDATQGQWLYRCIQIHDKVKGTQATERK